MRRETFQKLFSLVLIAVCLQAGAAVAKLPSASHNDEPDKVERGDNARSAEDWHEPTVLDANVPDWTNKDDYLESREAE
jgi:hypothetical protein